MYIGFGGRKMTTFSRLFAVMLTLYSTSAFSFGFVSQPEGLYQGSNTRESALGVGDSIYQSALFLGLGWGYADQTVEAAQVAQYGGFGLGLEAGYDVSVFETFGLRLGGFYGTFRLNNRANEVSKGVEGTSTRRYGATVGLGYRAFIFGVGLGRTFADVDTLFSNSTSVESNYSGTTQFLYSSFNILSRSNFGTHITALYNKGDWKNESGGALVSSKGLSILLGLSLVFQSK